jgi:hypothetical protein
MPQKGSMLSIKRILGLILAAIVVDSFITIPVASDILRILEEIPYFHIILMGIASYFLIIAGRQL